ncbi:MAG TPA: hypothetical protein VGF67_30570 [Ktedonobacteraceae bacterium]
MFDDEYDESPRKARKLWPILTAVAVLLIVLASLLLWQVRPGQAATGNSNTTAAATSTAVAGSTADANAKGNGQGQGDPPIYWQTVEQNIAQGLHLSVAQVKTRLQPSAGQRDSMGIGHVAQEQHIPEAQLRTIEIDAIQKGHDLLVRMGILTRQGSDLGMQRIRAWDQATLDDHVTGWFLNN